MTFGSWFLPLFIISQIFSIRLQVVFFANKQEVFCIYTTCKENMVYKYKTLLANKLVIYKYKTGSADANSWGLLLLALFFCHLPKVILNFLTNAFHLCCRKWLYKSSGCLTSFNMLLSVNLCCFDFIVFSILVGLTLGI